MLKHLAALAAIVALGAPVSAATYDLVIDRLGVNFSGAPASAVAINGQVPGPTLRWQEGEEVVVNVTNRLTVDTSIHWHGILLPTSMDGVPHLSFRGIKPGETFTYRFKLKQTGTYWFHSHSGGQEQAGMYGSIVITPKGGERVKADRDYVVMLSDWTDMAPETVLAKLKKQGNYFNNRRRTLGDLNRDLAAAKTSQEREAVWRDRAEWGEMRMDPTDIADVSGYTFLLNGKNVDGNWTGLFNPGEKIRLRFINGSAMTHFDVQIPGLKMTVIQADGQDVKPVPVDEFRIAVGETYDVIVEPRQDRAFTLFAQSMDRRGFARGTLAPRPGMSAAIPPLRTMPLLTMADMGHVHGGHGSGGGGEKMDHSKMDHAKPGQPMPAAAPVDHSKMDHSKMDHAKAGQPMPAAAPVDHSKMDHSKMDHAKAGQPGPAAAPVDHSKMDHSKMDRGKAGQPMPGAAPVDHSKMDHSKMDHGKAGQPMPGAAPVDPAIAAGLVHAPPLGTDPGARVLTYADLRRVDTGYKLPKPGREITLRLTGNMERYFWSFNDKKFSEAEPIRLRHNETVRLTFVNESMMNHPMHLHGLWMDLENGAGEGRPRKHVVNVPPGRTVSVDVTASEIGRWAFHCHLMFHMMTGMFREVIVEPADGGAIPAGMGEKGGGHGKHH